MCVKGLRRHKILFRRETIATAQPASIILDSQLHSQPDSQPSEKRPTTVLGVIPARLASTPLTRKVLRTTAGRALYFSRATIPYDRDARLGNPPPYWKHIGLYAYRKSALQRFPTLPPSALEQSERLEQLRFLENNIDIYVELTDFDTIGVDTEEDLHRVEALLRR